jgi:hypothetical protein
VSRGDGEQAAGRGEGTRPAKPAVPVGGGVPIDPETGERFGYLPRKAAQRKIIVRRALGLPWILGALAAAGLIAVTGVAFFASRPDRPPASYSDMGPLSAYPPGEVTPLRDGTGWADRRTGLTVWLTTADFCPADGGWQSRDRRWDAAGRPAGGGGALTRARVRAAGGRLYVNPDPLPAATERAPGPLPACPQTRPIR